MILLRAGKASLLVFLGACSYGLLATTVKIGYSWGYNVYDLTLVQFTTGFFMLTILLGITRDFRWTPSSKSLILAGTSIGTTGLLYYQSLNFTSVATAIILLMQSTWMGVIWESILTKKWPSIKSLAILLLILLGTFLGTGGDLFLNWQGVILGLLAALSYTITIKYSGLDPIGQSPISRTWTLLLGGYFVVLFAYFFWGWQESQALIFSPDWKLWGLGSLLGVLGTFLAPLLFSMGRPNVSLGTATMMGSIELPLSILSALILLGESVSWVQTVGLIAILAGVILLPTNR